MLRKNEKLVALIREAAEKHPKTSRTSLMRPLMDEIETALANGATREGLRDALAMGGIDMPIATFNSILHRYRNKHGNTKKAAPARQEKPTKPVAPVSPPFPKTVAQSPPDTDAPVYSIESVNVGADANGIDIERMKGKQFGELVDNIMMRDSVIVDVGASNVEDFLNRMTQYTGSHEEFDLFVVPVTKEQKVQADTVNTITSLASMGIGKNRIRMVFNRVDTDDDLESEFASVIGMDEIRVFCIADTNCTIYANELFERMKAAGKSLGDIVADKTDYRELLRHTDLNDTAHRVYLANMIGMKRLSVSVQENLDRVFALLTKGLLA